MTTHLNADHSVFEAEGVKVFIMDFSLFWTFILKFLHEKSSPLSGRPVAGKVPSCAALTE